MKFADVKNDIAFRKIFGNENRTESLISFLNSILGFEGEERILSVQILDPYQLPKLKGGKVSILDVRATDQKKRKFIVEMQVAEQDGFAKRVLYYLTKNYNSQIKRADQYRELKPAYFIGILSDFSHTDNPNYISRSRIKDIDTGEVTIKEVEFNFIELLKFTKSLKDCITLTDKWIFFIKNAENLTVVPIGTDDEGLRSAYEEANQHTWTQAELDAYDYTDMRMGQTRDEVDTAENRGILKGKIEGKIETAKNLKKLGVPIEIIKKATGLDENEIDKI